MKDFLRRWWWVISLPLVGWFAGYLLGRSRLEPWLFAVVWCAVTLLAGLVMYVRFRRGTRKLLEQKAAEARAYLQGREAS